MPLTISCRCRIIGASLRHQVWCRQPIARPANLKRRTEANHGVTENTEELRIQTSWQRQVLIARSHISVLSVPPCLRGEIGVSLSELGQDMPLTISCRCRIIAPAFGIKCGAGARRVVFETCDAADRVSALIGRHAIQFHLVPPERAAHLARVQPA